MNEHPAEAWIEWKDDPCKAGTAVKADMRASRKGGNNTGESREQDGTCKNVCPSIHEFNEQLLLHRISQSIGYYLNSLKTII